MITLDAVGLLDHEVWESNILVGDYLPDQGGPQGDRAGY
jgi:hypothetical protein